MGAYLPLMAEDVGSNLEAAQPRYGLGDIVIPAHEISSAERLDEISGKVASLGLLEATIKFPSIQPGQEELVISADGLYAESQARIRDSLTQIDIRYAIAGILPERIVHVTDREFRQYQTEVSEWQTANAHLVDGRYLEPIFTNDEPESARGYITAQTLSDAFAEIYKGERGASGRAGKMYSRIATKILDIEANRGARAHLLYGTIYFGNPDKSRHDNWPQSQWGFAPAVLVGMLQEQDRVRPLGFGNNGIESVNKLLEHITAK